MKLKDDIKKGDKFGRWTVLEANVYNPESKAKTKIRCSLCQCDCKKQTIKYIQNANLRKGASLSCGCLRGEQLAIKNADSSSVKVGNAYGKLTVIQDLGMRPQPSRNKNERWSLCQCSCGSEPIEVKNNMLQNGWKKSCGCLQSQGEFVIEKILKDNNINFIKEYKFSDLLGNKGSFLRFDFAIFDGTELKYLIEFDGIQHFDKNNPWFRKDKDDFKTNWAKENNIPLIRIKYNQLENLSIKDLLLKEGD